MVHPKYLRKSAEIHVLEPEPRAKSKDLPLFRVSVEKGSSARQQVGPDGRRFKSRKAAEEVRHAVASKRKRGSEASDNGNSAKRAKGAKGEASRKAPADAQKWLTEGCRAEMQMQDGGMVGSRYAVSVVQLSEEGGTRRAEVLFDGLYAEVDGKAAADNGAAADAKANVDANFSPELIDEKLWVGAAAAGWRLRQRGGKSKYYYISPAGERFKSKKGAEDAAGIERVKPKPLSMEELLEVCSGDMFQTCLDFLASSEPSQQCDTVFLGPDLGFVNIMVYKDADGS